MLTLPQGPEDYLKGRKRQALRTNLRKCDQMELSAARVTPERARNEARRSIYELENISHLFAFSAERHAVGFEDWIGFDGDLRPISFARLKVDSDIALLTFLTAIKDDESSVIRYRISADIIMSLASRGIKHIVLFYDGPFEEVDGYFAERLGFLKTEVEIIGNARLAWSRTFFDSSMQALESVKISNSG